MTKSKVEIKTGRLDVESSGRPVSRSRPSGVITLLTDFGNGDYFAGAMNGVILSINPEAKIVDVTHEIPPQDIQAGAFNLLALRKTFPRGTVHLAVVDPGVGSSRRPIVMIIDGQFYVGPDNGIFSYVADAADDSLESFHLTNSTFFRQPVSQTFNGRDIFAPVAAWLSKGTKPTEMGSKIKDYVRLPSLKAEVAKDRINGRIIHIDHFGNCVTNITQNELHRDMIARGARAHVGRRVVKSFRKFFAEDKGDKEKVFMIWGSAGFLEVAAENDSAARILKVKRGDQVVIDPEE